MVVSFGDKMTSQATSIQSLPFDSDICCLCNGGPIFPTFGHLSCGNRFVRLVWITFFREDLSPNIKFEPKNFV